MIVAMSAKAGTIWMSAGVAEKIRGHGAEAYPEECCGALLGGDGGGEEAEGKAREIVELIAMVNRQEDSSRGTRAMARSSARNRFLVTPQDVLEVEKTAVARGLDVIGWYHSHPDHAARPSEVDREHAWPWYSYVIVSVRSGVAGEMSSWRLRDDREGFFEERMEIRPETGVRT
jgi:proteasome lid subunit RPN8/RPN11